MSADIRRLLDDAAYLEGCVLAHRAAGDDIAAAVYFDCAADLLDEAMRLACEEVPDATA